MSSVIELYEHNQKAYDALLDMLGERDRACIIKPTGTGKFVIIAKMVQDNPDKRFLLLGTNDYMFNDQMANLAEIAPGFTPENLQFMTYAAAMGMERRNELAKKYNNYWWKCPNCGCEWQRALWIAAESNLCPACEGGHTLAKGWNDLKTVYPDIAADWDYEKNGGLKPSDVMARSGKKVWWKCRTCHGSWQCEVSYRVQDKKVCPYCKKKKLLKGFNDLKSQYPEIAKDYLPELNDGVPADEVIVKYTVKVRWRCHICGHEWICAVGLRTREKNPCGCAVCGAKRAGRKISKRAVEERGALSVFNPALAANWDYKKNGGLEPDSPEFRTNQKYWFICKVCGRSYQTRATITRKPVCTECQYKIGRSAKRKVVCVETGAVYKGISAAGRAIGRSAASVSHALKAGTCSGGYHWQYLDE